MSPRTKVILAYLILMVALGAALAVLLLETVKCSHSLFC